MKTLKTPKHKIAPKKTAKKAASADFNTGKSAKIAAAIKAYEADGDYARIADYLPVELAAVPKHQLRVCEAAVQLDFLLNPCIEGKLKWLRSA